MAFSEYIDCANNVGVFTQAALNTHKFGLGFAVFFTDMLTTGAFLTGMVWRHRKQYSATPHLLIVELAPKLAPALI